MKPDEIVPDYKHQAIPVSKLGFKPSGHIIIDGHESAETLACKHCGAHWIVLKGSGRKRGWCLKCKGPLCGIEECLKYHIPVEDKLTALEKGLNLGETLKMVDSKPKIII